MELSAWNGGMEAWSSPRVRQYRHHQAFRGNTTVNPVFREPGCRGRVSAGGD